MRFEDRTVVVTGVTEDLFDELNGYAAKHDDDGIKQMFASGSCTMLRAGESISVISPGFIATVRYKGVKLFTASEAIR
jgi:hypothetical protein